MKRKVIKPNVVSGGVAIPLGDNMYLMKGRKHKNGGIDIGNDPKTGIEVEDGEVMQMTNKGAKIFSAMPLLRGSSPANKVLAGENPDNVFRQQELYKDRNNINDDGTKKKAAGGIAYKNAMRTAFGDNYPYGIYNTRLDNYFPEIDNNMTRNLYRARLRDSGVKTIPDKINPYEDRGVPFVNKNAIKYNNDFIGPIEPNSTQLIQYLQPEEAKALRYNIDKGNTTNSSSKFSKFFKNKDNVSDLIGVGSNILGSTLSYFRNKSMLKNMQAPIKPTIVVPASYQQTKLKTNVNINPQLDTLRNSSAIYNNSVDNNTASSRVALARKQANRMNINNQINTLYGNKENQETELINKDRMQQQQTANQNVAQYNDYLNRKAALDNEYNNQLINFKNAINEKKAENAVSLFNNANAAIQDILGRREQRTNERNTIAAYLASHPDVSPELYNRLLGENNPLFDDEIVNLWKDHYKKKLTTKTK